MADHFRETYDVGVNAKFTNTQLNMALKRGLAKEVLKMAKEGGKGSGHYKLIDSAAYESKTKVENVLSSTFTNFMSICRLRRI